MWKIKKVYFSTFRLCDFSASLHLSTFRFFFSPLDSPPVSFVLLAVHVHLERHPVKNQTVRKWKVKKYTFRLFDFSKFTILKYFKGTFSLFGFLLFDFSKLILHTFRLEPCITSFLPRTPLNSAEVHRVHRVAVAQRGGIAGAHPTQQRGTDQPLGRWQW